MLYIMSKSKEKICRLCLKMLDDDHNVMKDYSREILEILQFYVDLSISEEPLFCKSCMESAQEAFNFTSTCISVEEQVVSLAKERNSEELDIRDVYLKKNENKGLAFNEDYNICRFCLQCLEKSNFNLNDLRKNLTDEMLSKCIPELDLNIIKEPVVCAACLKSLESYYSFAIKCQNTEENIMKYCDVQGAERSGQINLSNVLEYLFDRKRECIGNRDKTVMLKEEDNLFENAGGTYFDINNVVSKIEEDEFVIKDENQYLDGEIENERCVEIKGKNVVRYDMLSNKDSSEKHILIHKDMTIDKGNLCSYEADQKSSLRLNNGSFDKIMYRCERCTFKTKYKRNLTTHMLVHKDNSEVIMYKCDFCSFEAKWKTSIRNHLLTHKDSSNVVMYRCESCTFETKHRRSLKSHMLIHKDSSEIVMYRCDKCTFETKRGKNLKRHMLIHKDNSEVTSSDVMYRCDKCTFETKCEKNLKRHMLIHKDNSEVTSSDVMYRCEMCTFETKYKWHLKSHILIHKDNSEVTMFKCNFCCYKAKRKDYLRKHMFTHKDPSDIVMYRCDECTFETKHKSYLKTHMLIHKDKSEVTTYKCNLCSYEAKRKDCLTRHMLTHKASTRCSKV